MHRTLVRCLRAADAVLASSASPPRCRCHLEDHGSGFGWPLGEAATYTRTRTAVAFTISELPESVPKPSSLQ
jgi:hypothetical protein